MTGDNAISLTCTACPHACALAPGAHGICRARMNRAGRIVDENYGRVTSLALDPVEKKPLACWNPGSYVLSVGSYGCSMRCQFCQNASIAQVGAGGVPWHEMQPDELVERACELRRRGCIGIAFTYNEPLCGYEFVRDTAKRAHEAGMRTVLVSNGMATDAVLDELAGLIDAANIDLKCFTAVGYRRLGGDFAAVRHTIERLVSDPVCHVEVTTLVVPGLSDGEAQIDEASAWLASLDPSIPYHLTRFFPCYRMAEGMPTPLRTLASLADVARTHLDDVLLGNV
ncbi:MAG: AmmeMemoRadiSam system radical SAM enzyme [Eggerthellaceae bacterium]|jgi:pyruvate formate lyase activating enzyme